MALHLCMKFKTLVTFLIILSISLSSCDRPQCTNENLVFKNNEPNSKEYKDELVAQLNKVDRSKLTYWLQKYEDKNDEQTLYFYIQGDGLCAIIHLTMNHWNSLESVREKKAVGRRGAEFINLKFKILQDSLSTEFIYQSYDRLID